MFRVDSWFHAQRSLLAMLGEQGGVPEIDPRPPVDKAGALSPPAHQELEQSRVQMPRDPVPALLQAEPRRGSEAG